MCSRGGLDQIDNLSWTAQVGGMVHGAYAKFAQFGPARVDCCGVGKAVQHDVAGLRRKCLRGGEAMPPSEPVVGADLPASL